MRVLEDKHHRVASGTPIDQREELAIGGNPARTDEGFPADTRWDHAAFRTSATVAHTARISSGLTVRDGVIFRTFGSVWQKPASTGYWIASFSASRSTWEGAPPSLGETVLRAEDLLDDALYLPGSDHADPAYRGILGSL